MSPTNVYSELGNTRFPRVSGDEPDQAVATISPIVFSPRERG